MTPIATALPPTMTTDELKERLGFCPVLRALANNPQFAREIGDSNGLVSGVRLAQMIQEQLHVDDTFAMTGAATGRIQHRDPTQWLASLRDQVIDLFDLTTPANGGINHEPVDSRSMVKGGRYAFNEEAWEAHFGAVARREPDGRWIDVTPQTVEALVNHVLENAPESARGSRAKAGVFSVAEHASILAAFAQRRGWFANGPWSVLRVNADDLREFYRSGKIPSYIANRNPEQLEQTRTLIALTLAPTVNEWLRGVDMDVGHFTSMTTRDFSGAIDGVVAALLGGDISPARFIKDAMHGLGASSCSFLGADLGAMSDDRTIRNLHNGFFEDESLLMRMGNVAVSLPVYWHKSTPDGRKWIADGPARPWRWFDVPFPYLTLPYGPRVELGVERLLPNETLSSFVARQRSQASLDDGTIVSAGEATYGSQSGYARELTYNADKHRMWRREFTFVADGAAYTLTYSDHSERSQYGRKLSDEIFSSATTSNS